MTCDHIALLRGATKKAILDYARMACTSETPPESFIRDICAQELHRNGSLFVRIEFPARDCAKWDFDRSKLKYLSKDFRIDLVCFREPGSRKADLEMLVEFKLWTDQADVSKDVDRLRELTSLLTVADENSSDRVAGYVVCVPHYENLKRVRGAISDFAKHFGFDRGSPEPGAPFVTGDYIDGPSAGIVIIDVNDCRPILETQLLLTRNDLEQRVLGVSGTSIEH